MQAFTMTSTTNITIYHNPMCTTSRNVLALIRNTGAEPEVIEYLLAPPTREKLSALLASMQMPVRALLRQKGSPYDELQLDNLALTDDALLNAMAAHPILMERPIVITPLGTRVCRPSEAVLDLLPSPHLGAFSKEDGQQLIDDKGERVAVR